MPHTTGGSYKSTPRHKRPKKSKKRPKDKKKSMRELFG